METSIRGSLITYLKLKIVQSVIKSRRNYVSNIYFKCFFFTSSCPFFIKLFLQMYIQEPGEETSPILSFLLPFAMIWNKKLSANNDIGYINSNRIALRYMLITRAKQAG